MLKKYVVERDLKAAASRDPDDASSVIARARRLFSGIGTGIVWVESFLAEGKAYSVYLATDESLVHEFTRASGVGAYRLIRVLATAHSGTGA